MPMPPTAFINVSVSARRTVTKMMSEAKVALFLFFLHECGASKCKVTCDEKQTKYKTSLNIGNMTIEGLSWGTQYKVYCTNKGKVEPVESCTADTLIASSCIDGLVLMLNLKAQDGTAHDFTANCSTSCEDIKSTQVQNEPSNSSTGVLVGEVFGVLVGVLAAIFIVGVIFKFRDKIFRWKCCFKPVKTIPDLPHENIELV